jgi:hypothetical protein
VHTCLGDDPWVRSSAGFTSHNYYYDETFFQDYSLSLSHSLESLYLSPSLSSRSFSNLSNRMLYMSKIDHSVPNSHCSFSLFSLSRQLVLFLDLMASKGTNSTLNKADSCIDALWEVPRTIQIPKESPESISRIFTFRCLLVDARILDSVGFIFIITNPSPR